MNKKLVLQSVLEGYAAATPDGNDLEVLRDWMDRYPDFADGLLEFAAARTEMEHLPDMAITEREAARYRKHGLKWFDIFATELKKKREPIPSLTERAKEHGMNKESFANAVGLSLSLLMYLEKRRLRVASIPDRIIRRTAEVLRATKESVEEYLQSPQTSSNLSFKVKMRPAEIPQKDFAEAVKEDQTLTDEEKRALLE